MSGKLDNPVPDPDNRGYVYMEKDGALYRTVPESVEVWLADGWKVVDHDKKDDRPVANEMSATVTDEPVDVPKKTR